MIIENKKDLPKKRNGALDVKKIEKNRTLDDSIVNLSIRIHLQTR
jgi:hypothetical protein